MRRFVHRIQRQPALCIVDGEYGPRCPSAAWISQLFERASLNSRGCRPAWTTLGRTRRIGEGKAGEVRRHGDIGSASGGAARRHARRKARCGDARPRCQQLAARDVDNKSGCVGQRSLIFRRGWAISLLMARFGARPCAAHHGVPVATIRHSSAAIIPRLRTPRDRWQVSSNCPRPPNIEAPRHNCGGRRGGGPDRHARTSCLHEARISWSVYFAGFARHMNGGAGCHVFYAAAPGRC